jgi:hypothetical protein
MIENDMVFTAPDRVNRQAPRGINVEFLGGLVYYYADVAAINVVLVALGKGTLII